MEDHKKTVKEASFNFAKRVVFLYKYLKEKKCPLPLVRQILRSGTSIGANIEEATAAQSKKDFLHKLMIARKEARETMYWLQLLNETEYLSDKEFKSIAPDCTELLKLLTAIIKTVQKQLEK